jgi:pyochelin biosynthesis protein PchC
MSTLDIRRHGPLTLVGHSMGAILGFEVAPARNRGPGAPGCLRPAGPVEIPGDETVPLRDDAGILAEVRALNGTASSVLGDALLRAYGFSAA